MRCESDNETICGGSLWVSERKLNGLFLMLPRFVVNGEDFFQFLIHDSPYRNGLRFSSCLVRERFTESLMYGDSMIL